MITEVQSVKSHDPGLYVLSGLGLRVRHSSSGDGRTAFFFLMREETAKGVGKWRIDLAEGALVP